MNNKFLYPKGSEWRKWDLHIHTPFSYHYNYRGKDAFDKLIEQINNSDVEVFAITDYFTIEGYKELIKKKGKIKKIILPGIELRLSDSILPSRYENVSSSTTDRPVNIQIIFDNDERLLSKIEEFVFSLEFKDFNGHENSLIKDNIIKLGKQINSSLCDEEAYKEGCKQIRISKSLIENKLKEKGVRDKALIILPYEKYGGIDAIDPDNDSLIKSHLTKMADIIESSRDEQIKFFLGQSKKLPFRLPDNSENERFKTYIGKPKPCINCSDSHSPDTVGKFSNNKICWIKSDPTFEGLKQIIYEPEERVLIDDKEPEILRRVVENKTKFITLLKINQVDKYDENKGKWFKDIEIPLNPGLVAIIGNKGNGKSAITDILGLCGNSHLYKDFSFLREDKFLKDDLAKNFVAEIQWESGESVGKNLSDSTDTKSPERVRYIPQNFFERLTNDLESYDFEKTLEDVVFSHLPDEWKLGKNSFEELFRYKKQIKDKEIEEILKEIKVLNQQIIELEKKIYPDYETSIRKKLEIRKRELEEHEKNKPKEIPDPHKDKSLDKKRKELLEKINLLNEEIEKKRQEIKTAKENLKRISIEIQDLEVIKADLQRYDTEIKNYIKQNKDKFSNYGLNINEVILVKINIEKITDKIGEKKQEQGKIKEALITETDLKDIKDDKKRELIKKNSLIIKEKELENQIKVIKNNLSEPDKKYQEYLENLKKWEDKKKQIEGDEGRENTIKWLEKELKYIKEKAQKDLDRLRNDRLNLAGKIFEKKIELVNIYKNFKDTVDKEISQFQDILGEYEITIDASLKLNQGFFDDFLNFINKKVKGSFYGIDEGKGVLEKLVKDKNLNVKDDVINFLKEIIIYLEKDKRDKFENEKRYIKDQILKEEKWIDFYNYIFSLNYIEPVYELKLGNKNLTQLSPGERGALLIVFYLLLDKEDIPLIIDQPEENLDNESVYKILTHFIRYAKRRRQVIIVTHNPNLAIVGDAEQIIFVKIDKKEENTFSYESGSIENPKINKYASNILEGTLKAFDIRRLKYIRL